MKEDYMPRYKLSPPATWLDPVVVDRLIAGTHPGPRVATPAERAAAARVLLAKGTTVTQIGLRIRTNAGTTKLLLEHLAGELSTEDQRLRDDVGGLSWAVQLDVNPEWIGEPYPGQCGCGYEHDEQVTVAASWTEPDYLESDPTYRADCWVRSCAPAFLREIAEYAEGRISVDLGIPTWPATQPAAAVA